MIVSFLRHIDKNSTYKFELLEVVNNVKDLKILYTEQKHMTSDLFFFDFYRKDIGDLRNKMNVEWYVFNFDGTDMPPIIEHFKKRYLSKYIRMRKLERING